MGVMSKFALCSAGLVALTGAVVLPLAISLGAFAPPCAAQAPIPVRLDMAVTGGPEWITGDDASEPLGNAQVQP